MRSARYFAADHGVKYARFYLSQRNLRAINLPRSPQKFLYRLPTREVQPSPGDEKVNDEAEAAEGDAQSRSSRDQRVPPDWYVALHAAVLLSDLKTARKQKVIGCSTTGFYMMIVI